MQTGETLISLAIASHCDCDAYSRSKIVEVFLLDRLRKAGVTMTLVNPDEILHLAILNALFEQGVFSEERARIHGLLQEKYESTIQEYSEPIPEIISELLALRPGPERLAEIRRLEWPADDIIFLAWPRWDGEDETFTLGDLSGIEGLVSLETLSIDLAGPKLDLGPLRACSKLSSIVIECGGFQGIEALAALPHLKFLDLRLSEEEFDDEEHKALLALRTKGTLLGDELMVQLGIDDPDTRIEALREVAKLRGINQEADAYGYSLHLSQVSRILDQANRRQEAIGLLEQALEILLRIGKYAGQAAERLAKLYETEDKLELALGALERYWQQPPGARNYISGFDLGARLYEALGRRDRALWALFKDAHHAYGADRFYTKVHELVRALPLQDLSALRQELQRDHPDEPAPDLVVALKYFQEGKFNQAETLVDDALSKDEYHPLANYLKAVFCSRNGQFDEAAERYSIALKFDRRSEQIHRLRTYNNRIDALLRAGKVTDADECLSEALKEAGDTQYATLFSTAAEVAFRAGRPEEARNHITRGIAAGFDFGAAAAGSDDYAAFVRESLL